MSVCILLILLMASHLPFLSGGPWKQGRKKYVPGCLRSGAQTAQTLPQYHIAYVHSTSWSGAPQTPGPSRASIGLVFVKQLDSRIRSFPTGPSLALCLPFSHPQVLAPGSQTQFKWIFLRKVILQQHTQPEKAALKSQQFNQSNKKITGCGILRTQKRYS